MRVSQESFCTVIQTISEALEKAHAKLFLTEYDVQSWLFGALAAQLGVREPGSELGLHCQTQFLKDEAKFGFVPDLAVLNLDEYSIGTDGELYGKKGCTIWGDSILIEIKLHRGHSPFRKADALKDIQKLAAVRQRHYQNGGYFPIFVLVCRLGLRPQVIQELQDAAEEGRVCFIWHNVTPENPSTARWQG